MQRRAFLRGAAASALAAPALAQTFPDRPIRLIIPYAPGGGTDATMRVLVGPMGEILGQSFVVENRTGGAGSIGAAIVAQARPDGYTLLADPSAHALNHYLLRNLAFAYERFDCRPRAEGPLGDDDVLAAEALHGRLDPAGWAAVRAALDRAGDLADAATERAAGRPLWELPDEEFSVLREPGTVGAVLRGIQHLGRGAVPVYVAAALHHRRPELFPLVGTTTRRQLLPHVEEGDSGVEAVVHRELRANAEAFAVLETAVAGVLGPAGGVVLTRLRLHDLLVWASGSLRLTHAVSLGTR